MYGSVVDAALLAGCEGEDAGIDIEGLMLIDAAALEDDGIVMPGGYEVGKTFDVETAFEVWPAFDVGTAFEVIAMELLEAGQQ